MAQRRLGLATGPWESHGRNTTGLSVHLGG